MPRAVIRSRKGSGTLLAQVRTFRPLTLTGGIVLALALGIVIVIGNFGVRTSSTLTTAAANDPRGIYDAAYQLSFRSDGGHAPVTVDAVYEYPKLVTALAGYAQRGVTQGQILDVLATADTNVSTLAFSVTIAAHNEDVSAFDLPAHATLTDDLGRTYPKGSWYELVGVPDVSRAGILTFGRTVDGKSAEVAGARTLTLTLEAMTGGRRTFVWDLRVLGLNPA